MNLRKRRTRALALAFAVPALAVGAIAISATAASSSATYGLGVVATDAPGGGTAPGGGGTATAPGTIKTLTKVPTATKTATKTPTKTATATRSATPSASAGASGLPVGPGGGPVVLPSTAGCGLTPVPPVSLKLGQAGGKQALVDGNGCAVYLNTGDTAQQSACDATCQATWVPVPGPATPGEGLDAANFTVFTRADGSTQVAYFGHQLYWYTGDTAAGQANGQGMNQAWYLIDQAGNAITS